MSRCTICPHLRPLFLPNPDANIRRNVLLRVENTIYRYKLTIYYRNHGKFMNHSQAGEKNKNKTDSTDQWFLGALWRRKID